MLLKLPHPPFPPLVPFEVICGGEDEILAPPDPAFLDMQLVDGVGHIPHIEATGDVIAAIRGGLGTAKQVSLVCLTQTVVGPSVESCLKYYWVEM